MGSHKGDKKYSGMLFVGSLWKLKGEDREK